MKTNFWINNAILIAADGRQDADLHIRDGVIADVVKRPPGGRMTGDADVDATGLWLLPGGVDAHVHFGMPLRDGIESRGWRESSIDALLGGTTTVIDFANHEKGESLHSAVARWREKADRDCLCDYGLHVTVADTSQQRLAEIPRLIADGMPTFKAFLAYKNRLMLDTTELGRLMEAVRGSGGALWLHAEDGELNATLEMKLRSEGRTQPRWHPAAHPPESEIRAVAVAIELAQAGGCPLTIVHLSTAAALALVQRARADGGAISAEVCIHHLFRDAGLYDQATALGAILSPPLRDPSDTAALRAALNDPAIVQISTDHCAFSAAIKAEAARDGFPAIPNGAAGVGERLIVTYTLAVLEGLISPERWVELCCTGPARHAGLSDRKGRLAVGLDADVVLFDPEARNISLPLRGEAPLWDGGQWRGRITDVWRRGRQVVKSGNLQDDRDCGLFLARTPAVDA